MQEYSISLLENVKLVIVNDSVINIKADAIVNAANCTLLGGGGVDGAIHRACGPKLLEECRGLNGCKTSEAKITQSYDLKTCKYIIHTVGPIFYKDHDCENLLEKCYQNPFKIALNKGLSSMAFPCISAGVYGAPIDVSAKVAISTLVKCLKDCNKPFTVFLACYKEQEFKAYIDFAKSFI